MSNRLKMLFSSAVFLLLIFTQTADLKSLFPQASSISEKEIIQGVGTDPGQGHDSIMLTMAAKAIEPPEPDSESGGSSKSLLYKQEGRTFLDAMSKIQSVSNKTVFLEHMDVVVIGEDAAKENFLNHVEYLFVYPKINMDIMMFVAKGCSAQEIFEVQSANDNPPSEKLVSLMKNTDTTSVVIPVKFSDIVSKLEDKHLYSRIPAVTIEKQGEEESLRLNGYALLKEEKLLCYLDQTQSVSLNIFNNNLRHSPIVVDDETFGRVTVDIVDSSADIKYIPDSKNGRFEVSVRMKANFSEQYAPAHKNGNIYSSKNVLKLQNSLNQKIKSQLDSLVAYSHELNEDIIELSTYLKISHPKKWKALESEWGKIYRDIPVNIKVESNISNFFILSRQIGDEQ